jgi:hypothetical protein
MSDRAGAQAAFYDRFRPGPPPALIDHLVALAPSRCSTSRQAMHHRFMTKVHSW